jgi:hypothetical protein
MGPDEICALVLADDSSKCPIVEPELYPYSSLGMGGGFAPLVKVRVLPSIWEIALAIGARVEPFRSITIDHDVGCAVSGFATA